VDELKACARRGYAVPRDALFRFIIEPDAASLRLSTLVTPERAHQNASQIKTNVSISFGETT